MAQSMQVDRLDHVVDLGSLSRYVEHLLSFVQSPEGVVFVVILLVPILVTALMRQVMPALLVLLLSFASLMLFAVPGSAIPILGIMGALSCYFVALHTIILRKRTAELKGQIANLVSRVAQLENAEQRRLLLELRKKQCSDQPELALGPNEETYEGPLSPSPAQLQQN